MQTNTSHYLAALAVTFAAIAGSAIAADFNPQPDPPGKTQKRDAAMHKIGRASCRERVCSTV